MPVSTVSSQYYAGDLSTNQKKKKHNNWKGKKSNTCYAK